MLSGPEDRLASLVANARELVECGYYSDTRASGKRERPSMAAALRDPSDYPIVAEVKLASPTGGRLSAHLAEELIEDFRLGGAAALSVLRATRLASMPNELRRARALLEARSLGDLFRTELAIEVLANDQGDDVDRLRADIYWKGKRWREAGEGYERVLGNAWQKEEPLTEEQRLNAMRAGLAYVLGEEKLSLDRLRGRYLAKMAKSEDAGAFNLITNEKITRPQAFRDVARNVVNTDTMVDFMASYRKRYPETGGNARPVRSAGDPRQSAITPPAGAPTQPLPKSG